MARPFIQPAAAQGPKAVMGPGTGLGQANLYWSQNLDGYRVWPSEGSHSSFAPRGWKQRALQTFVERQLGYCEVEHVSLRCSGCNAISWGSTGLTRHHLGHLQYISPDMWPLRGGLRAAGIHLLATSLSC